MNRRVAIVVAGFSSILLLGAGCGGAVSTSQTGGPSNGGTPADPTDPTPTPTPGATPGPKAQLRVDNFFLSSTTAPADGYEPNGQRTAAKFLGGPGFLYTVSDAKIEPVGAMLKVDFTNGGDADASAFEVDLFLDVPAPAPGQRGQLKMSVPALPAGGASSLTFAVPATAAGGNASLAAMLDAPDVIDEADETDNLTAAIAASLPAQDVDWFSVDEDAGFTLQIQLDLLPADYDLELYNGNGTRVGVSATDGTAAEVINYAAPATGRYYVKVLGYLGAASATPYRLQVSVP